MEKYVKHKMPYTKVIGLRYNPESKEMENYEVDLPGRLAINRAQTRARREECDATIIVTDVEHFTRTMACDIDTFLSVATEID